MNEQNTTELLANDASGAANIYLVSRILITSDALNKQLTGIFVTCSHIPVEALSGRSPFVMTMKTNMLIC